MNFLGCELVHFNPNAIVALSCFKMLCECWLGIAPDTSLFWYFYSSARYNKVVYSRISLSLRRHRIHEYIDATFKSSWQGSQSKWLLIDMHIEPQWANMQLYLLLINNKQGGTKYDTTPGRSGQAGSRTMCHRSSGVSLCQRIYPSTDSPPWP
jgi:hypothetical protein